MRFLVDAQLPPALAVWLGARGYSAFAVRELGLRDSDDGTIYNFCTKGKWIIVTKDEDFVQRCLGSTESPQVLWLRSRNCTNQVLFAWLDTVLPEIMRKFESGEKIVEVRRRSLT